MDDLERARKVLEACEYYERKSDEDFIKQYENDRYGYKNNNPEPDQLRKMVANGTKYTFIKSDNETWLLWKITDNPKLRTKQFTHMIIDRLEEIKC